MELTVENRLSILARFYFLRPMFCRLYEASKVKKFHSTSNFFLTLFIPFFFNEKQPCNKTFRTFAKKSNIL